MWRDGVLRQGLRQSDDQEREATQEDRQNLPQSDHDWWPNYQTGMPCAIITPMTQLSDRYAVCYYYTDDPIIRQVCRVLLHVFWNVDLNLVQYFHFYVLLIKDFSAPAL